MLDRDTYGTYRYIDDGRRTAIEVTTLTPEGHYYSYIYHSHGLGSLPHEAAVVKAIEMGFEPDGYIPLELEPEMAAEVALVMAERKIEQLGRTLGGPYASSLEGYLRLRIRDWEGIKNTAIGLLGQ